MIKHFIKATALSALFFAAQSSHAQDTCDFTIFDFAGDMATINLPVLNKIGPFYDENSGLVYVFPPDGPKFKTDAPNCDFFKWAAQMFLWTTSSISDTNQVPASPAPPSSSTPYVFNSEFFYSYSGNELTPQSANGSNSSGTQLPHMTVRSPKPKDVDTVAQAGGNGVLLSQPNNTISKASSLVYYAVHTNRVFGYVAAQNLATPGTYSQFPTTGASTCSAINYGITNGYASQNLLSYILYDLFCGELWEAELGLVIEEILAAITHTNLGIGIPELEPAIDYLSMAVELKTSWVEASTLKNPNNYILQYASVPTYTQTINPQNNTTYWKENGTATKELALVGMHIVGSVNGHPEMIWATVEHKDNAPNAAYSYLNSRNSVTTEPKQYGNSSTSGPNSTWLFSDGTADNINTEYATLCSNMTDICPSSPSGTIQASNVVRTHPWGVNGSSQQDAAIANQLLSLNYGVFGSLMLFNASASPSISDPRENYFVSGATWGKDGYVPTTFPDNNIKGGEYLANTTMETFNQEIGCFECHQGTSSDSMATSHILSNITKVNK